MFSGVATLILNSSEISLLDQQIKVTLQRLQKLPDRTPHCVVMFLGGHLPGKALLHMKLFSIFGMIARIPESFINRIAVYQLTTAKPSSGSWFLQIRDLCIKYELPSPLSLLQFSMKKEAFKKLIKSRVVDFWEVHLRTEAARLQEHSLRYFKPEYMSLTQPHLLWSICGSNPFEIHKTVIQAKMLSARYVTDKLSRYLTTGSSGLCSIPGCTGSSVGSLEHLLLFCPALSDARNRSIQLCHTVGSESEELKTLLDSALNNQTSDAISP